MAHAVQGADACALLKEASSYDTIGNGFFAVAIHAIPAGWRWASAPNYGPPNYLTFRAEGLYCWGLLLRAEAGGAPRPWDHGHTARRGHKPEGSGLRSCRADTPLGRIVRRHWALSPGLGYKSQGIGLKVLPV